MKMYWKKQPKSKYLKKQKTGIFTLRAESHPHGTILTDIRKPGGQLLCVKWCSILFEAIQEKICMSVMDLQFPSKGDTYILDEQNEIILYIYLVCLQLCAVNCVYEGFQT